MANENEYCNICEQLHLPPEDRTPKSTITETAYRVRIEELELQLKTVKDFAQLMQHLAEETNG